MTFKIKLEDKAAFLNRMEKQGEAIDSKDIKDNKLEGYFEVTINNPKQEQMAKNILKQSPKINTVKEMKKGLTKSGLKEMIRIELNEKKKIEDKKKKLDEISFGVEDAWIPAAAAGLGITISMVKSMLNYMKDNNLKGIGGFFQAYKEIGKDASKTIDRTMGGND
jgi:hypothetical protein